MPSVTNPLRGLHATWHNRRFNRGEAASLKGRLKGSSCMKGNFHVQFLRGWGAAMLAGYLARLEKGCTSGTSLAAYPTKGTWPGAGVSPFPCRRCRATGEQAEPHPSVIRP